MNVPVSRGIRLPRTVSSVGVAILLVSLVIPSTPLVAATTTYTSAWGGGTINAGDTAVLNNGATVTGNVVDNGTLQFNQTGTLTITSTISGTGTLSLTNTGTLTLSGTTAMPGIFGGTVVLDMTVNATQGRLKTANTGGSLGLVLGNSGTGTMNVNGGVAQIGNNFYLGYAAGGRGVVNLSSGTLSAYNLVVGGSGAGAFNLSGGSMASTGGRLTVAESNSGTFTMTGGTVSGFNVTIGTKAGSVGTATISSGSWDTGNSLIVGGSGAGTLTVSGGALTSSNGSIGRYAGSVSTATVTGGTWAESANLTVGASGTGTLNLTGGVLTVGGTLSIGSYGTVVVGNGGTTGILLGGTGSVANAGSLQFNRSDAVTYAGSISGTGSVTKQGAGTLTLTANNSYSGVTTVSAGTLAIGSGGTTGSIAGNVANNAALAFNRSDALNFSGTISGTGAVVKQGGGTLTLTGSSSYTGGSTITGGTLQIGDGGTTGSIAGNVVNNAALAFNRSDALSFSGTISGTGSLVKQGLGTLTLSASNAYTGATAVNGGVLAYGTSNALADSTAVTVTGGGLDLGSYTDTVASFTITSGSLFGSGTLTAATYTVAGGTVTGNLGSGTLTVTGNSNLNGTANATTVLLNAGALTLGSASRFTSNQVALTGSSGASVSLGGGESVGSLAGGFDVALGSATLTTGNNNTSTTYSGILSGSGGLTKAGNGTFTISGANSYSGLTQIAGGTLALSGSGSIGSGGLNLGTTGSPGVFDLAALMSGTYFLPATGDLTGVGTLAGNGKTLAVLGSFLPGNSPGTVTVGSGLSLNLSSSGSSVFEITNPAYTAGTYDLVSGGGSVVFGGILNLVFSGGVYADGANVLRIFATTGGRSGSFSSVVWSGLAEGQKATFDAGTGYVSITAVPEPATYAMALAGLACGGFSVWRRRKTLTCSTRSVSVSR